MSSSNPKILLTGATGYIGGSILSQLLSSPDASKYGPITCLVRGEERQKILTKKFGDRVNPLLFADLDDSVRILEIASQHDIAINTTNGYHAASARNIVLGLAKRKRETGKDVWMIHTSGTSNMADRPITKKYLNANENQVFSDKDDIYGYEKKRNEEQPYLQRIAELGVIDTGIETGVKTIVIMSPLIFGTGTGEFNKLSIQIPALTRFALQKGYAVQAGDGKGIWNRVHIADLAKLYQIVLDKILAGGEDVPFGKRGIIFSEAGSYSWGELAQGIADAAFKAGKIPTREVKSVGVKEMAEAFGAFTGGDAELLGELGLASNSRTKGDVSRSLGWKPEKGDKEWQATFEEELNAILAQGV